jgi:thiamine pyrophosphate-dependent acetolactate synthase large subunit-like protein
LAYPDRQSIAVVGDGGFAMLMAELSTAVSQNLPVKIILLKNNSLAEVKFEQKEIGNPAMVATCRRSTSWRLRKRAAPTHSIASGRTRSSRPYGPH